MFSVGNENRALFKSPAHKLLAKSEKLLEIFGKMLPKKLLNFLKSCSKVGSYLEKLLVLKIIKGAYVNF